LDVQRLWLGLFEHVFRRNRRSHFSDDFVALMRGPCPLEMSGFWNSDNFLKFVFTQFWSSITKSSRNDMVEKWKFYAKRVKRKDYFKDLEIDGSIKLKRALQE
jgi:hypothetical protein